MVKTVQIIANPAAGPGLFSLRALHNVFSANGIEWDISLTHRPGHAMELARAALRTGVDVIAAFGGDGTVREVAGALAGSDVPLAILPGGTGNVFATELGIPRNIRLAARLIAGPHRLRTVDVGMAGREPFLVAAATGVVANSMRDADQQMKEQLGYLAYVVIGFRELANPMPATYELTLDGQQASGEGMACVVSNTSNFGISGVTALPWTDISDGMLDVVLLPTSSLQAFLALMATTAGFQELAGVLRRWQVQHVILHADPPQQITCDGDMVGETPVEITILHRALKVIVPERAAIIRPGVM